MLTVQCLSRRAFAQTLTLAILVGVAGCSKPPVLTDRDTILIADFSNTSGDNAWTASLRPVVTVLLQQSPFFTIVSDQRTQRAMKALQQPPDQPVAGDTARTVCTRLGAKVV